MKLFWLLFALMSLYLVLFIIRLSRMVEFGWISDFIWGRPQEAGFLRHLNPKYHWETLPCPGRRYRDYPAPSAHSLPGRTWRPQAGFRRWLSDVVRKLVGHGMVPWYVMKSDWCLTHNNPATGAKQKCMHYINYFHYYHYLLEQK